MHSESFSAFCGLPVAIEKPECRPRGADPLDGLPPLSDVPPPFVVEVEDEEVWLRVELVLLTLAIPGLSLPLPPQAERRIAAPTAAATSASAREIPRRRGRCVTV
jgi:hypothetical protein